ncbi:conjugal transfer protein TraD, partial [Xanthomonas euvesicatoria]
RYRKKHQAKTVRQQTESVGSRSAGTPTPASSQSDESVSDETYSSEPPTPRGPISMQELDRLMKPDPAKQAQDIARYERLAKQKERSRK